MESLKNEINALRQKQYRIEKKQKKDNAEIWNRIELLSELIEQTNNIGSKRSISDSMQISINKIAQRRGWKNPPE